jgi:hypothetical protein
VKKKEEEAKQVEEVKIQATTIMGNKNTKFNEPTSKFSNSSPTNSANGANYLRTSTSFPNDQINYEHTNKKIINLNKTLQHINTTNHSSSSPFKTKSLNRNSKYNYISNSPSSFQKHQHHLNENNNNNIKNPIKAIANLTASPLTLKKAQFLQKNQQRGAATTAGEAVSFNQALRTKHTDLTNAMKTIDSNNQGASYQTSGSKLYKPNSFLIAKNGLDNSNEKCSIHLENQINTVNTPKKNLNNTQKKKQSSLTSSSSSKSSSSLNSESPQLTQNSRKTIVNSTSPANLAFNNNNNNNSKTPDAINNSFMSNRKFNDEKSHSITNSNNKSSFKTSNTKLNKRFGLSPRFKRKIVETIKNGVHSSLSPHHNHNRNNGDRELNQKFNQVIAIIFYSI